VYLLTSRFVIEYYDAELEPVRSEGLARSVACDD
jgi:hypothetical protein